MTFTACKKEAPEDVINELKSIPNGTVNNASQTTNPMIEEDFRINNQISSPFNYENFDSTITKLVETGLPGSIPGSQKVIWHVFTSQSFYYDYGILKGRKACECDKITEPLAFLADSLNMDSIVNTTGVIPQFWTNLERKTSSNYLGNVAPRGVMTQINKNFKYQCGPSENNSSIFTIGFVGGVDMPFDRSWYRRKLINIWSDGFDGYDFCNLTGVNWVLLNNKACSWWSGGI
jgi:hypothetical protein